MDSASIQQRFEQAYGRAPTVVARAPGRVNLIGEHTDYNDGFVLPMALEQSTWVAAAPRDDRIIRAASAATGEQSWPLGAWSREQQPHWTSYIGGVAELTAAQVDALGGVDLYVHSDVPLGSGLSSSAALEVATALALGRLAGVDLAGPALADLARQAEHEYAGVPCGIMDQYISVLGRAEHALLLDCRSREYEQIPLNLADHAVVIVNSGVKHELAGGEYAARQRQCQEAVTYFQREDPEVRALRDVPARRVQAAQGELDDVVFRRARHVVTENNRTVAAAEALRQGDLTTLGALLAASHDSLRDDYEVSCPELDQLVDIAGEIKGVVGARMTGGGFGGCIVAIVHHDAVATFQSALAEQYDQAGGTTSTVILSRPGAGAAVTLG